MMRALLAIFCLLALVFSVTPVWADDGFSFDEDEAVEIGGDNPFADVMEEGKRLYEAQKYEEASLVFYGVAAEQDFQAEAFRSEAEYELAKTLFRMGLYQGAITYFGKIVDGGPQHPYFIPTLRGLVLLTDVVAEDPSLISRMTVYGQWFDEVPSEYRDRFAFLVGRQLYSEFQIGEALRLLEFVSPRSPDYARARYLIGITHVANYDAEPAVESFRQVLRQLRPKKDAGTLTRDERRLYDLTILGMARVFYSTGSYDTAIRYFNQIDRRSRQWPTALFESSWAYFQLDQFNRALGNLHTINSPFFADYFFPEGPILSAVLYFYNCRFDRVRFVLDEFDFIYEPMQRRVAQLLEENRDNPEAMYAWLREVRNGGQSGEDLQRIAAAALDDRQIREKLTLIEFIEREIEALDKMPDRFKSGPLGISLRNESNLAVSFARADTGDLVAQRLERVSRELTDLTIESQKILFEVSRAERGEIEAELRAEIQVAADAQTHGRLEVSDEEIYWRFDGEYWRDELGYYIFNVSSECRR